MKSATHWMGSDIRRVRAAERGVTMVEMIVVIAATGILIAAVSAFISRPVEGYMDSSAHAQSVGAADTALRRVSRDLRTALPNSVRVSGAADYVYAGDFIQYLEVRTGGRYRAEATGVTAECAANDPTVTDNNILSFGFADTCFKALSNDPLLGTVNTATDYVVVFNLGIGVPNADAYETSAASGGNKSRVTAVAVSGSEDRYTIASNNFTYRSPGNRFFVIDGPVAYRCDLVAKTLTRYWGYGVQSAWPPNLASASSALMASNVTSCSFGYSANVANVNAGVVTINLAMTDTRGGVVTLLQQAHVNNVP